MTITTEKAMDALAALEEVRGQKINKAKARELYLLRKKLVNAVEFFQEEQKAILDRLGAKIDDDGKIRFGTDKEKAQQYLDEIEEVKKQPFEIEDGKVNLTEEDLTISEAFLEAVEDLIDI